LHEKHYGLSHFRVLTVVPSRQRIGTVLATHQAHTAAPARDVVEEFLGQVAVRIEEQQNCP
jgi:hypothetical protein